MAGARLVIDVSRGGDVVSGSVDDGTAVRPFHGWLQLMALIEHALPPAPGSASGAGGRGAA